MIRIVIADDHGLLRAGLNALLSGEPDFTVVGEAKDGGTALSLVQDLKPDILIADISMPAPNGIEVAEAVRRMAPGTRVIILTVHEDEGLVREAIEAGAAGYVSKRVAESELIRAVRTVAGGGVFRTSSPAGAIREEKGHGPSTPVVELDGDEVEMLRLIALGYSNTEIARRQHLSADAVASARRSLGEKYGLQTRVHLVRYAHEHGIV